MTLATEPLSDPNVTAEATAFATLTDDELALIRPLARPQELADGEAVFRSGQADVDFFVVESGLIDILNPAAGDARVTTHRPGEFTGDVDLLTGRAVVVSGVARGPTRVLRVPAAQVRQLLNRVPRLGEKLLVAFQLRRALLVRSGGAGVTVVGPASCRDTTLAREFLYRNFEPFTWYDSASPEGAAALAAWGSPGKTPAVRCPAGNVLVAPSLRELAQGAGMWRACPDRAVDLAVVGAGPAGVSAAVYAASEGLSTVVLDRLGPGGQASGSSKIENFMGFPAGLSGAELATRGVIQMLKFGATLAAPVAVDRLEPASAPGRPHALHLDCGATVRAPVVLAASGVHWRKLDVPGADRFERAGVYYACTAVEALLHENQDVAVVGAGNSAGQAAVYLSECCRTRTVHMLVRHTLGPEMSEYLVDRVRAAPNVVVREGVEVAAVHGDRWPESVDLKDDRGRPAGNLPVGAVFVFIGSDPHAAWLPDTVARDKLGYLLTGTDVTRSGNWPLSDREPCPLETTLPGVLAAGDVRAGATRRVGFAVGDGSLAVTCVHRLRAIHA